MAALPRDRNAVLVFGGDCRSLLMVLRSATWPGVMRCRPYIHAGEPSKKALWQASARVFADGGRLMGAYAARVLNGIKPADSISGRQSRAGLRFTPRSPAPTRSSNR